MSWYKVILILFTTSLLQDELIYLVSSTEAKQARSQGLLIIYVTQILPLNCIYVAFLHFIAKKDYLAAVWWFQIYKVC